MKIRPMHDNVLVKFINPEKTTPGGLLIPETAAAAGRPQQAEVLAVGQGLLMPDGKLLPLEVAPNQVVLLAPNTARVEVADSGGDKAYLVQYKNIVAVLS